MPHPLAGEGSKPTAAAPKAALSDPPPSAPLEGSKGHPAILNHPLPASPSEGRSSFNI